MVHGLPWLVLALHLTPVVVARLPRRPRGLHGLRLDAPANSPTTRRREVPLAAGGVFLALAVANDDR